MIIGPHIRDSARCGIRRRSPPSSVAGRVIPVLNVFSASQFSCLEVQRSLSSVQVSQKAGAVALFEMQRNDLQ